MTGTTWNWRCRPATGSARTCCGRPPRRPPLTMTTIPGSACTDGNRSDPVPGVASVRRDVREPLTIGRLWTELGRRRHAGLMGRLPERERELAAVEVLLERR